MQNKISDPIAALLDAPAQLHGEGESHAAKPTAEMLRVQPKNSLMQLSEEVPSHWYENASAYDAQSLEQVADAYHRMALVHNSVQTAMSAIEAAFVNTSKALYQRADKTDEAVHELQQRLHEEQKAFQGAIQKALTAQLAKMQKQTDESMKALTAGLESYLAQKEEASKRTLRYVWAGIIISFILGGLSAATLLLGALGK